MLWYLASLCSLNILLMTPYLKHLQIECIKLLTMTPYPIDHILSYVKIKLKLYPMLIDPGVCPAAPAVTREVPS